MPDLIIKPEATSGNKLILKDQAGGAVLTTADSGATLGNSTQDNITRLGTVTAGNLSNSSIVYPDGHVIQTVQNTYNGNLSAVKNGNTPERVVLSGNHHWTGQITNVGAGNWVRVTMSFSFNFDRVDGNSGTATGAGFSVWRESTEIMSSAAWGLSAHTPTSGLWNFYWHYTLDYMDESPATGTNNYYLGYAAMDSNNQCRIRSDSSFEPFRCILQEIKK